MFCPRDDGHGGKGPSPEMGYPDAAPASLPQRQARGRRTCHPRFPDLPRGPHTYCQSPWSRQGLWGCRPRLGYPRRARPRAFSAGPARSGTRDAHRRSRRAPPPRRPAPRGRPRRRPYTPAEPSQPAAGPALPCPPRSSIPPKDKAASNLAHSSPDTLPALFTRCTLVFLPRFFQFIRAWRFFPAGSTLSPSLQEQIWGTGGREQQESPSCLQGLRTETHQVLLSFPCCV